MPRMRRRELLQRSASALLALTAMTAGSAARAWPNSRTPVDLKQLQVTRTDDGVTLSYDVRFDLPKEVEDALLKGVSLVFLAEAETYRSRWYWTDKLRSTARRRWRLTYQPLTRQWRLSFDGLSRHYSRLVDALNAMRRGSNWRIADTLPTGDDQDYYVDFKFKLDTDELPRPLQLSLGIQSEWDLAIERRIAVPPPR
ncbi:DUF4390 domain-containing protein [Aquabacterium sp.]|uniref:DUF4390 domain-containing protein n=1 Tax=Aquabacterium sp. TaxID=1872578 RepID=UPI002E30A93C|nr:DUF4390 domain-containing protein [Aquabacterium sp.]HEX5313060.1 DUF4390 domain-containing protein [Aquabacterium sp.]